MLLPEVSDERIIMNLSTSQLVRIVRRMLPGIMSDALPPSLHDELIRQRVERVKTELKGN